MEKSMSELVEEYRDVHHIYSMEGDRGVKRLEKLLEVLGYKGHSFKYGTVVESFLSDNSGAIDAIVEWISNQDVEEWKARLEEELPPQPDEEDDDVDLSAFEENA
jgi:hypothetical protein